MRETIRCDMMNELLRSQVSVEFLEVTQLGQNGLDFQLSALLGCLIGGFRGTCLNIYIISKDTGFDVLQDGGSFFVETVCTVFFPIPYHFSYIFSGCHPYLKR